MNRLTVPCCWLNTYGCQVFHYAGPIVWNSLPDELRYLDGFDMVNGSSKQFCLASTGVTSIRGYLYNEMYYIDVHFTFAYFLFILFLMPMSQESQSTEALLRMWVKMCHLLLTISLTILVNNVLTQVSSFCCSWLWQMMSLRWWECWDQSVQRSALMMTSSTNRLPTLFHDLNHWGYVFALVDLSLSAVLLIICGWIFW